MSFNPFHRQYDFYLGVSRTSEQPNYFPGHERVNIRGKNLDIDTGTTPEDLISFGGTYSFPTALETIEVLSSSAADTAAGTGARTVLVTGLDNNYDPVSETVTLSGTTAVNLVNQYFRVNQMRVVTVGSGGENAGTITLRQDGAGLTRCQIPAGAGIAGHAIYTVRAGYTGYIVSSLLSSINSDPFTDSVARSELRSRIVGQSWITRWDLPTQTAGNSNVQFPTVLPHPMAEGTDLKFRCVTVSDNNTAVLVHAQMVLVSNRVYFEPQ